MKILGNRVLVSKVEEPKTEGFTAVKVQDDFIYKGKIEQIGSGSLRFKDQSEVDVWIENVKVGAIILFARNSPDTQDVEFDGKKMKVIKTDDIIATL